MLTRRLRTGAGLALALVSLCAASCEKVPLLAPTGSTITLTASASALSANGTTTIIAQVLEAAGTPPHSGTHVTFLTTLGRVEPAEVSTDANGRATVTFMAGGANGTATVSALSGGATTGTDGALKIAVGSAAVSSVSVSANPTSVSTSGGASTITARVLDVNGNSLASVPVNFSTNAGTLSTNVVLTNDSGIATTTLTTTQQATVTATVGASTGGTTGTGSATGTVTVNVSAAPAITIAAPAGAITKNVSATFTFTVTAAASNGSPVKDVTVNWGDGSSTESLGSFVGASSQSHTYRNDGTYRITATVTDVVGGTGQTSSSVSVVPLAQVGVAVTISPANATVNVGQLITFTMAMSPPSGVTVRSTTIDWGDNVVDPLGGGSAPVGSHAYAAPTGAKTVTIRVLDSADQTTTVTRVVTVIP